MQWLKTWLMKWLGVDNIRAENSELIQRLDVLGAEVNRLSNSVGANGAAIYNFYEKLDRLVDATNAVSKGCLPGTFACQRGVGAQAHRRQGNGQRDQRKPLPDDPPRINPANQRRPQPQARKEGEAVPHGTLIRWRPLRVRHARME